MGPGGHANIAKFNSSLGGVGGWNFWKAIQKPAAEDWIKYPNSVVFPPKIPLCFFGLGKKKKKLYKCSESLRKVQKKCVFRVFAYKSTDKKALCMEIQVKSASQSEKKYPHIKTNYFLISWD